MTLRDAEKHLRKCMDSILGQTYAHWELLVVDDHSADGTADIVSGYASEDPRIKIIEVQGKGIIHGLRSGYAMSQGQYITRMDGDDVMSPDKLAVMVDLLERTGKGHVAVGSVEYFSDGQLGEGYKKYAAWLNDLTRTSSNYTEIYKECVIPSPCWMMHRTDFEVTGGFEVDRYPEDYDLVFRMRKHGMAAIGTDQILHYWRDHEGRTSRHDPNYSDNTFLDIKLLHFLEDDRSQEQPLVLWGAGKKGKALASRLNEKQEQYHWITGNEKKIGKKIYDVQLKNQDSLQEFASAQVIVMISSPNDQEELRRVKATLPQHQYFHWM